MPLIPQQDILLVEWRGNESSKMPDSIKIALESYPPVKIISMSTKIWNGGGEASLVVETV